MPLRTVANKNYFYLTKLFMQFIVRTMSNAHINKGVNSVALRFVTKEQMSELINLYHLSRVALSGTGKRGKYEQMLWATSEFHKLHPDISATAAYKDLDGQLAGY